MRVPVRKCTPCTGAGSAGLGGRSGIKSAGVMRQSRPGLVLTQDRVWVPEFGFGLWVWVSGFMGYG
jgi:hypothetical protein